MNTTVLWETFKRCIEFLDAHNGTITALATVAIVVLTGFYVRYSGRQWQVMEKQLHQSERPWVGADILITQPLVFDQRGAVLGLTIRLKNVGHSVAQFVSVWMSLKFGAPDLSELERLCAIPKSPTNFNSDYGYLLFPDQQVDAYQPVIAPPKEIAEAVKGPIVGKVLPYLLVCIDYRSAFEPLHCQTRLLRLLSSPDPKTGIMMGAFDPQGVYPQLALLPQM